MPTFPPNDILSLLDASLPHNLAESTSADLGLGELLDARVIARLGQLALGYGPSRGAAELRALMAESTGVDADEVLVTQGGASALFLAMFTLCSPGDEIAVAMPQFPPSVALITALQAVARPFQQRFDEGYQIDLDGFRAALSPATRLAIVATPHNPSGVVASPGTLRRMAAILAEVSPGAYLLVDETYREATYGDAAAPPSAATLGPRVLTVSSISKALGAPGLRIGWLTCRDRALMELLVRAKLNVFISCSVVDEALAAEVLRRKRDLLRTRGQALATGLERVAAWAEAQRALIEWVRPQGGALSCIRLRAEVYDSARVDAFCRALPAHDVMLGHGAWFYEEERVFRLGFGYLPLERLDPALAALGRALEAAAVS
jgi:aspartate/methionine/tyrosine aminotransferase